jgi:predicted metal-dependent phosphoesterase TrpH
VIYADLHLHTTYSDDSSITPKILLEKLVAHSVIKVAAVTDHDTTRGLNRIRELALAYPDILIIPGVEISAPEGDVVVLGAEETPPEPWTVENVMGFARDNNCISVVAHPYREYGMGDLARNYRFDAVEIFNGASSPEANKQAKNLAKQMGLPGVAGSDAHRQSELCTACTEIDAGMNVDEILTAIKKGKVKVPLAGKGSIRF